MGNGFLNWGSTTFAALAVRDFRLFYIGQGLSLTGTWARRTALGWYVFEVTNSYQLLGLVMGLALLPLFVFAPLAGSLADNVNKRHMIMASQVMSCVVSALLAVMVLSGNVSILGIMILATLGGVSFAFEVPARQAYVVEMVGRDKLINAIALNSALVNLSRIFGPVVAGVLMGWMGAGLVFALDAFTYLIVLGMLSMLRTESVIRPPTMGRLAHLKLGLIEAWTNRPVRNMLLLLILAGTFGWSFNTLMPAIAQDVMKLSEERFGALMAMFGAGAFIGALYVAGRGEKARLRLQVYGGMFILSGGLMVLSFTTQFWTMAPLLLVSGFGGIMFLSTANTLIQTSVNDDMRGRVMGLWSLVFGGSLPIGSFVAGLAASVLSPFQTIRIFTAICIVGTLAILYGTRHQAMRRADEALSTTVMLPDVQQAEKAAG